MAPKLEGIPKLVAIDDDVWTVDVTVGEAFVHAVPWRMTLLRTNAGVIAISPVPLDDNTWDAIASKVGEVRHVVAPNLNHSLALMSFLAGAKARGWNPQVWFPPGLRAKVLKRDSKRQAKVSSFANLAIDTVIDLEDDVTTSWGNEVGHLMLAGVPLNNEIVFFHVATKTLVVTDAIVNVVDNPFFFTRSLFRVISAYGGPKQPSLWRKRTTDRQALTASVARVLEWPFERVICAHGDIVAEGGRDAFAEVFRWTK